MFLCSVSFVKAGWGGGGGLVNSCVAYRVEVLIVCNRFKLSTASYPSSSLLLILTHLITHS